MPSTSGSNMEPKKALDELFQRSVSYRNSKNYLDLLLFINKFPSLSPFNAFLIHMQNKGVEIVMSAKRWNEYGRQVKQNARPLVILVPFGPVNFVYDIADTDGDNIPDHLINPFITHGKLSDEVLTTTRTNCLTDEIRCVFSKMSKANAGYATKGKDGWFEFTINSDYGLNEQYSTLVHELAHIYAGHLGTNKTSWWENRASNNTKIEEIEAESICFLVCNRLGLQSNSEMYLSNYIEKNETLPEISLDVILTVSLHIENLGKRGFKAKKRQ